MLRVQIKYLQGMRGKSLSYRSNVTATAAKARKKIAALLRLMPNVGGLLASKRWLLSNAVRSIFLYAVPIWREALNKIAIRNPVVSVQRSAMLKIFCAYRSLRGSGVGPGQNAMLELLADKRSTHMDSASHPDDITSPLQVDAVLIENG